MKNRKHKVFHVGVQVEFDLPDSAIKMVNQVALWLDEIPNALIYASKQGAYLIEMDNLSFLAVMQGIWVYLFKLDMALHLGLKYLEYPYVERLGNDLSRRGKGNIDVSMIYTLEEKDCYRALAKALGQPLCRGNATAERLEGEFEKLLALPKEEVVNSIRKYLQLLAQANAKRKEEEEMPTTEKQVVGVRQWHALRSAIAARTGTKITGTKEVLRAKGFEILGLEDDGTLESGMLVDLLNEQNPVADRDSKFNKYGELNIPTKPLEEEPYLGPVELAKMRMEADIYAEFAEPTARPRPSTESDYTEAYKLLEDTWMYLSPNLKELRNLSNKLIAVYRGEQSLELISEVEEIVTITSISDEIQGELREKALAELELIYAVIQLMAHGSWVFEYLEKEIRKQLEIEVIRQERKASFR